MGRGRCLGFDAAGVVAEVGAGVTGLKAGDAVFYSPDFSLPGAYAEYNLVRAELVAAMPSGLTFEQAAALPLAGMTAWDGLFTRGGLTLGQTVLIAAANGGVGSLAVQLAKAAGAWVAGTCSTRSMEFVRGIPTVGEGRGGPDRVLNYQTEDWAAALKAEMPGGNGGGLDLVYDCAGGDVVSRCLPLMKAQGQDRDDCQSDGEAGRGVSEECGGAL